MEPPVPMDNDNDEDADASNSDAGFESANELDDETAGNLKITRKEGLTNIPNTPSFFGSPRSPIPTFGPATSLRMPRKQEFQLSGTSSSSGRSEAWSQKSPIVVPFEFPPQAPVSFTMPVSGLSETTVDPSSTRADVVALDASKPGVLVFPLVVDTASGGDTGPRAQFVAKLSTSKASHRGFATPIIVGDTNHLATLVVSRQHPGGTTRYSEARSETVGTFPVFASDINWVERVAAVKSVAGTATGLLAFTTDLIMNDGTDATLASPFIKTLTPTVFTLISV